MVIKAFNLNLNNYDIGQDGNVDNQNLCLFNDNQNDDYDDDDDEDNIR